jgi:guanosine-3',5'-bis(diphosphate) 3'-pyrophosphohydrolase
VTWSSPSPLAAAVARSALVAEALDLAREAHAGQVRNGSGGMAYIEHPEAVAAFLAEQGWGDEVLAAALLHDVVEDSETTVADLQAKFGEPIAGFVASLSDDESIADYRERKAEHRARVASTGPETLAIYAADKLTNINALRRAYAEQGQSVAEDFKVPLELKLEAWEADLGLLEREAPELSFLPELSLELGRLREDLAAAAPRRGT